MSARRHNLCLVDTFSDASVDVYENMHDTGVMRRPPRESYTHERPLVASVQELRPSLAADLVEPAASIDEELVLVHLRPTVIPVAS